MKRMSKPSQEQKILAYLQEHKTITQAEAVEHLKCYRLAARISDMKRHGHRITSTMTTAKNAAGETSRFAVYGLETES